MSRLPPLDNRTASITDWSQWKDYLPQRGVSPTLATIVSAREWARGRPLEVFGKTMEGDQLAAFMLNFLFPDADMEP